jgi:hypothetical protein
MQNPANLEFPAAFGRVVADAIPHILKHQRADGAIVYDGIVICWPQQAIFPLALCFAGLDPDKHHKGSPEVRECITKLSGFLVNWFDDQGQINYDSLGNKITNVDQRLTHAWTEALHILRQSDADFDYAAWGDKITRACKNLISHRLQKLVGIRRFVRLSVGTGLNHAALYISTVYRAGQVLNIPEFCDLGLKLGRALAADVHPDGYWEEHSDLLCNGGPTTLYNYLSHNGMALMYAWTGEQVFLDAIRRSTNFHGNFCYPDATLCELIDERVRYHPHPFNWGLAGFSHSPEGRGSAIEHFKGWLAHSDLDSVSPEILARQCENYLYWNSGDIAPAPFTRPNHTALLNMPGGLFRRGAWSIGLSAMRSYNHEDPGNRENPFALDRQKLFSVWHEKAGMLLDGSHSKNQPDNSTFAAKFWDMQDCLPSSGKVCEENGELYSRAIYKCFYGTARLRPVSDSVLKIELSIDPAGCCVPIRAGFTLQRKGTEAETFSGSKLILTEQPFELTREEMGGGFRYEKLSVESSGDFKLHWPLAPFNSYAADKKHAISAYQLRVSTMLSAEWKSAEFTITVKD